MFYTLKNEYLTVKISDLGAELCSVQAKNGCEYMWQPEAGHWQGHAPWLFPICSRLYEGRYTYRGRSYQMPGHGFAHTSYFTGMKVSDTVLHMTLTENDETLRMYPFEFLLTVTYTLIDDRLLIDVRIVNPGRETLIAGLGAHPGFRVPLSGNGKFDEWFLEFAEECRPFEMTLSRDIFWTGRRRRFPLENDRRVRLDRSLFAKDGHFLSGTGHVVTLKSFGAERAVTLTYEGMPYLGFWSEPSDVGFVCVEPWHGLPSVTGVVDDLETKRDLFHIAPGGEQRVRLEMRFT